MDGIWHGEKTQLFVTFKIWLEFKNLELQRSHKYLGTEYVNVHIFEKYFSLRTKY